jgi:hypothetical protein
MPESFTCVLRLTRETKAEDFENMLLYTDYGSLFQDIPESGLNHILFRCDAEEFDISEGKRGPYGLFGYGQFPYAGLTSVMHIINN